MVFLTFLICLVRLQQAGQERLLETLDAPLLEWEDYEYLLVASFIMLVPGAFVVCTLAPMLAYKRDAVRQQADMQPLRVHGRVQSETTQASAFSRCRGKAERAVKTL